MVSTLTCNHVMYFKLRYFAWANNFSQYFLTIQKYQIFTGSATFIITIPFFFLSIALKKKRNPNPPQRNPIGNQYYNYPNNVLTIIIPSC